MTAQSFQRYAIYWLPEDGSPLAQFGARWFANASGGDDTFGLSPELAHAATKGPAHYRLHATLKAPFRPRDHSVQPDLQRELDLFCQKRRPPSNLRLKPVVFGKHLALMPSGGTAEVDWLAMECATAFDRFRAPLSDRDRERRGQMTARQAALFEEFGYPYVMSEFRFHVSLAGPLEKDELFRVRDALAPHLNEICQRDYRIESMCLLGEPSDGPFELISRHSFMRSASLA
jgi:hypothetical protein